MLPRDLLRAEGIELQGRAVLVPPPVCSSGTGCPALGLPPALGVTLGSVLGTAVLGSGPPQPPSACPEQAVGVQSFRTAPFASFLLFILFICKRNLIISGLCSRGSGSCPLHPCTAGPVLLLWLRAAGEMLPALFGGGLQDAGEFGPVANMVRAGRGKPNSASRGTIGARRCDVVFQHGDFAAGISPSRADPSTRALKSRYGHEALHRFPTPRRLLPAPGAPAGLTPQPRGRCVGDPA